MKNLKKVDVKARGSQVNTKQEEPLNTKTAKIVKQEVEITRQSVNFF